MVLGDSALTLSARKNYLDVVDYLLKNGALCNNCNIDGQTALCYAALTGNLRMVRSLIAAGANVCLSNGQDNNTPLLNATSNKFESVMELLLGNGGKLSVNRALVLAFEDMFVEGIKMLFNYGASHTIIPAETLQKALSRAITVLQDGDFVQCLVEHGADVNKTDDTGTLPLTLALSVNNPKIFDYLVEAGADVNQEVDQVSFLEKCVMQRSSVLLGILLKRRATIKAAKDGSSLLARAATFEDLLVTVELIEAGANTADAIEEIEHFAEINLDFRVYWQNYCV